MAFQEEIWLTMSFSDRLVSLRKSKALTQQALADQVGVHVVQIRRYEAGDAQPTLDVIRKLAIALSASADTLVFDEEERDPKNDFKMQFEVLAQFDDADKQVAQEVLEGLILKHQAKQSAQRREAAKKGGHNT